MADVEGFWSFDLLLFGICFGFLIVGVRRRVGGRKKRVYENLIIHYRGFMSLEVREKDRRFLFYFLLLLVHFSRPLKDSFQSLKLVPFSLK